jgi:hypothetical protein
MRLSDLPEACPQCGYTFSRFLQQPRWQKKAALLLVAGCALTIPWIWLLSYALVEEGTFLVPSGGGLFALAAIYLGPGILSAVIAYRMRRIVPLRCRKCCWSQVCLIDTPRYRSDST